MNGYLPLATSCDGTLATTATPTTVRVVYNNTLAIALEGTGRAIKVPHNTRFDPEAVKKQLGIAVSQWEDVMYRMRTLAERKVQWHKALGFFMMKPRRLVHYQSNCPTNVRFAKSRSCTKAVARAASSLRHAAPLGACSTQ